MRHREFLPRFSVGLAIHVGRQLPMSAYSCASGDQSLLNPKNKNRISTHELENCLQIILDQHRPVIKFFFKTG